MPFSRLLMRPRRRQIHVSPVSSVLVQLRHLTPPVMTLSLTLLGGSLDSNAECRWVTMLPCLLIISYMYLKAHFIAFPLNIYASPCELKPITWVNWPLYSFLCGLCTQTQKKESLSAQDYETANAATSIRTWCKRRDHFGTAAFTSSGAKHRWWIPIKPSIRLHAPTLSPFIFPAW